MNVWGFCPSVLRLVFVGRCVVRSGSTIAHSGENVPLGYLGNFSWHSFDFLELLRQTSGVLETSEVSLGILGYGVRPGASVGRAKAVAHAATGADIRGLAGSSSSFSRRYRM